MREIIENKLALVDDNPNLFDERPVLDKGFVRLVDFMGDDSSIVRAARVSYGSGTKSVREDAGLIDYLIRHEHSSPLEMVEFTFHLKLPLFVMGQLVRHRQANLNQMSARYSVMEDEFYLPENLRAQSSNNKQSSEGEVEDETALIALMKISANAAYRDYEHLLARNVGREMSRMILPQNLYTQVYWKQDLRNLLHLLRLRMDSHAQWEIQQYANAIYEIIKPIVPNTVKSWENHVKNSIRLSEEDVFMLRLMYTGLTKEEAADRCKEEFSLSAGRLRETKNKVQSLLLGD